MRFLALRFFRWWCAFVAHLFRYFETDPQRLPILRLKNVSPRLGRQLEDIEIRNRADLVRLGALEVYRLWLMQGNPPNPDVLWALHGAITQQTPDQISQKLKAYLLEEAHALEPAQVS